MTTERLTHRERHLRSLRRQPVDRAPDVEFGAWVQTFDRWEREGMDRRACRGLTSHTTMVDRTFGTDAEDYGVGLALNLNLLPLFDEIVIEDRGQTEILQDKEGALVEQLKPEYGASIPRHIRYAIRTRADWERVCDERLDPSHPDRTPPFLDALIERLKAADYPVLVHAGSIYGRIRDWVGVENLSLMLYDDRALVEEMMEHMTQLSLRVLERLAGHGLTIDRADWWEDMCVRSGSLLSPRHFRELMVPRYKRITDFLRREFGAEFNRLDCDGNIHQLVLPWLDGGINVMFPIEVAHTDPFRVADQLGERGLQHGAFDKRALIEGPPAIDAELERLRPLVERGLVVPFTDHLVPPDVSLENYSYYRRKKCELIGKTWRGTGVQTCPGQLMQWRLAGLFDSFDVAHPPELDGRAVAWQPHTTTIASGDVDLIEAMGNVHKGVAYAAGSIHSPGERRGWLDLSYDDSLRVWLNGELLWSRTDHPNGVPRQVSIPTQLRAGQNDLLCQVARAEAGDEWGFMCRAVDAYGQPWQDVDYHA